MFMFHVALSLELLALLWASILTFFLKAYYKSKARYISFVGYFVIVLSLLSIICTISYGVRSWAKGDFTHCYMKRHMEKMYEKEERR